MKIVLETHQILCLMKKVTPVSEKYQVLVIPHMLLQATFTAERVMRTTCYKNRLLRLKPIHY